MKKSELRHMIATIVREEMYKIAPVIVEEFLTEKYLKALVERKQPMREYVSDLNDTDDEEDNRTPKPPKNGSQGIYTNSNYDHNNGQVAEDSRKIVEKIVRQSKNPMLAMAFEGTKPIQSGFGQEMEEDAPTVGRNDAMGESQRQFGPEGVPIDKLPGFSNRMASILKATEKRSSNQGSMRTTESAEERRLAEMRRKLDEQVVSPKPNVR